MRNFQIGPLPNRDFPSKIFAKGNIKETSPNKFPKSNLPKRTISKGKNKFPKAYISAKITSEIG